MAWFTTVSGALRRHMQVIVGLGIATGVVCSKVPQTVGLSQYKQVLKNSDKYGREIPVSSDLQELIEKVLQRINLRPEDEARIEFFVSSPQDPVHKGSAKIRTGAIIGLPATFACKNADDLTKMLDETPLLVNQKPFEMSSEAGRQLLNSLVLTDKAKAFAIARELNYVAAYDMQVDVFLQSGIAFLTYASGFALNRKFLLTERFKLWSRCGVFSAIAVVGSVFFVAVTDAVNCYRDNRADARTARLKKIYAEGGVDYYNAVLQRNQALRTLLGPTEGPRLYTRFGNHVASLRNPRAQLTSRRDNMVKYLKNHEKEVASQSEPAADAVEQHNS